jgi:hypothetical protein
MPPDPHVTHSGREGGGKDRDAIPVDGLEGMVSNHIPLKQYARRGVGKQDDVPVKAEELGYGVLI